MKLEDMIYVKKSLGRNGEPIGVYKIRTMSKDADERLHEALANGLDEKGKPVNDPRVTKLGRFLRKYWIDELPQVYNIISGEMSLVGIRPRRKIDWERFPEEHKKRSLKYKPGFLGAAYGEPEIQDFNEFLEAESRYLDKRDAHPFLTQIEYFSKVFHAIAFRGVRGR